MRRMILFALLVLTPAACGKKDESGAAKPAEPSPQPTQPSEPTEPPSAPTEPPPGPTEPSDPVHDYTKPYLTDEKIVKLLQSMEEGHHPLKVMFADRGPVRSMQDLQDKLEEINAFVRKYGFKDYEDYAAVWYRIVAGQGQIAADEAIKSVKQLTAEALKKAEEALKKPDLAPELRKMYEEQVAEARKTSEPGGNEADATEPILHKADLALVVKYQAQIEKAIRKFRKSSGGNK